MNDSTGSQQVSYSILDLCIKLIKIIKAIPNSNLVSNFVSALPIQYYSFQIQIKKIKLRILQFQFNDHK